MADKNKGPHQAMGAVSKSNVIGKGDVDGNMPDAPSPVKPFCQHCGDPATHKLLVVAAGLAGRLHFCGDCAETSWIVHRQQNWAVQVLREIRAMREEVRAICR